MMFETVLFQTLLTIRRSAHFIDPALRAILESSLTPDDNDLFLSNLVDTPVLAVHGFVSSSKYRRRLIDLPGRGADDNVPTWHSREAVGILQAWKPNTSVRYVGGLHVIPPPTTFAFKPLLFSYSGYEKTPICRIGIPPFLKTRTFRRF